MTIYMKYEIITPEVSDRLKRYNLQNLSNKVLSNASLNDARFDNLFFHADIFPSDASLKKVSERLDKALKDNEKIFVYGDYDADGVCATSLIVGYLKRLNARVGYYIPNRLKEGYGLTREKLGMAIEKGYTLVITVDNGVSAYEALDYAKEKGVDVILMDHHIISGEYSYEYILHPDRFEDPYFRDMCGAGVVLQFLRYRKADRKKDWILAMVATIGDMVPVFFANREIIKRGLMYLNQGEYPALSYLSKRKVVDEGSIGFDIVPNINTVGRLADRANVNNLVRYLLSEEEAEIIHVANQLSSLNKERQSMIKDAKGKAPEERYDLPNYLICVSRDYHEGIIGLLANSLLNEIHKPVIVFARKEDEIKGSGRSPKSFDIYENLSRQKDLFQNFGGHEQACGLTLSPENYEVFLSRLKEEEALSIAEDKEYVLSLQLEELTLSSVEELFRFRPFGVDFRLPDFYLRYLPVNSVQILKNDYRKCNTYHKGETIETMCFRPELLSHLESDGWHDIIVSLSINEFNGRRNVSLNVKDII